MKKPRKKPHHKTPPPSRPANVNVAQQIESTLGSELRKLKTECGKAHHRYTSEKDPIIAQVHLKQWMQLSSQVTAMAKVAPKADTEAGAVLKASEVEATWSRTIKEWKSALEELPRRVSTRPPFDKLDPVDVEEALKCEVVIFLSRFALDFVDNCADSPRKRKVLADPEVQTERAEFARAIKTARS
ncbi:MAG: hypothetical protein QOG67_2541 [Verrucomicrobiota bacterium]|jgi:hypothetical protein